jgi:hypothetical protein
VNHEISGGPHPHARIKDVHSTIRLGVEPVQLGGGLHARDDSLRGP